MWNKIVQILFLRLKCVRMEIDFDFVCFVVELSTCLLFRCIAINHSDLSTFVIKFLRIWTANRAQFYDKIYYLNVSIINHSFLDFYSLLEHYCWQACHTYFWTKQACMVILLWTCWLYLGHNDHKIIKQTNKASY